MRFLTVLVLNCIALAIAQDEGDTNQLTPLPGKIERKKKSKKIKKFVFFFCFN